MSRMNVVMPSKFEKLTMAEMQAVKGGLCISCVKRGRKIRIDFRFADKRQNSFLQATPNVVFQDELTDEEVMAVKYYAEESGN